MCCCNMGAYVQRSPIDVAPRGKIVMIVPTHVPPDDCSPMCHRRTSTNLATIPMTTRGLECTYGRLWE